MKAGARSKCARVLSVEPRMPWYLNSWRLSRAGQDHSLDGLGIIFHQVLEDLTALQEMIHSRRPEDQSRHEGIYLRYANARKQGIGKKHDVVYRMCNLFLERWNF